MRKPEALDVTLPCLSPVLHGKTDHGERQKHGCKFEFHGKSPGNDVEILPLKYGNPLDDKFENSSFLTITGVFKAQFVKQVAVSRNWGKIFPLCCWPDR